MANTGAYVLGLMSGTSMDGVDLALLRTDGMTADKCLATGFTPYPDDVRAAIRACLGLAADPDGRVAKAEALVTDWHVKAVAAFRAANDWPVELIGFHGQTIFHDPANGRTWQIGDGQRLADATGIPVVYDMRSNDMREGGQGAPLLPLYHRALAGAAGLPFPCCVLNLGGVANITWMDDAQTYACDTGPASALIDDWMLAKTGAPMDKDGATARTGHVDTARVKRWMEHPFFKAPPPKSLDRNAFAHCTVDDLSLADGAATLTAFTVVSVLAALAHMPAPAKQLIVCGGGRRNHAIMQGLGAHLPVLNADTLGWSGDHIEAEGFAYLAARARAGLPLSLPTTTGCRAPATGGVLAEPRK